MGACPKCPDRTVFKMDYLTRLIDRQPDHPTVFEFLQTELFARQFDVS